MKKSNGHLVVIRHILIVFVLIFFNASCDKDKRAEEAWLRLQAMIEDVKVKALSTPCTNPDDWRFLPYGHGNGDACGSVQGYIAYSTKEDRFDIPALIANYRRELLELDERYGFYYPRPFFEEPSGVICENGEAVPVFEYDN